MRFVVSTRLAATAILVLAAAPVAALAQAGAPRVDILEVSGTIDRPLARYLAEEISAAERRGSALLLLQMDTAGIVKASGDAVVPPLAQRILSSRVPVAVWAGPRDARIAGGAMFLLEAANVAAVSPPSRVGPLYPADLAAPARFTREEERRALEGVASRRGRAISGASLEREMRASEAAGAGVVDLVAQTAAELLEKLDGRAVETAAGQVTLRLPREGTDVAFHQPGPWRRTLHALANPALAYVLLLSAAMLMAFELFQPGFGVAGVSGVLSLLGAGYGLTVVPVRGWALALTIGGLALFTLDVAINGLGVPTATGTAGVGAGSLALFPGTAGQLGIPAWLPALGVVSILIFFVPVMTMVRRGRRPVAERAGRHLLGEPGQVRSVLNPEGFVWVGEALWRARSEQGEKIRVGEDVVVVAVDGAVLTVRRPE